MDLYSAIYITEPLMRQYIYIMSLHFNECDGRILVLCKPFRSISGLLFVHVFYMEMECTEPRVNINK